MATWTGGEYERDRFQTCHALQPKNDVYMTELTMTHDNRTDSRSVKTETLGTPASHGGPSSSSRLVPPTIPLPGVDGDPSGLCGLRGTNHAGLLVEDLSPSHSRGGESETEKPEGLPGRGGCSGPGADVFLSICRVAGCDDRWFFSGEFGGKSSSPNRWFGS